MVFFVILELLFFDLLNIKYMIIKCFLILIGLYREIFVIVNFCKYNFFFKMY